jgi:putative ATPase
MDPSRDAKGFGHGAGYDYTHSHPEHWTPQQYLPDGVVGTQFYHPGEQGYEAQVAERVRRWREAQAKALDEKSKSSKGLDKSK